MNRPGHRPDLYVGGGGALASWLAERRLHWHDTGPSGVMARTFLTEVRKGS